jgi:hypothetical protein
MTKNNKFFFEIMSLRKLTVDRWLNVFDVILHILVLVSQIHFELCQLVFYVFLAIKKQIL